MILDRDRGLEGFELGDKVKSLAGVPAVVVGLRFDRGFVCVRPDGKTQSLDIHPSNLELVEMVQPTPDEVFAQAEARRDARLQRANLVRNLQIAEANAEHAEATRAVAKMRLDALDVNTTPYPPYDH